MRRAILLGEELEGIAARGDFDLSQHQKHSGKSMEYFDEETKTAWAKLDGAKKQALQARFQEAKRGDLLKRGYPAEEAESKAKEAAEKLARGCTSRTSSSRPPAWTASSWRWSATPIAKTRRRTIRASWSRASS